MDYDLDGVFILGKIGVWCFDKCLYFYVYFFKKIFDSSKGMNNDLVRVFVDVVNEVLVVFLDWGKWGIENVIVGFN